MYELTPTINNSEIKKGFNLLGLHLSDSELNEFQIGDTILLENRTLGEIGSAFILAAALSASNLGKKKKKITFRDLDKSMSESEYCSGIPVYCWFDSSQKKCCIYLTLIDGKPAVRTWHCCFSE